MHHFGALGEGVVVGHEERREPFGVQVHVGAVALPVHDLPREVHEHDPFVDLDHPVLQPRPDAQFVGLDAEDERGQLRLRDLDIVEGHQRTHRGGDDAAGAGQPHAQGNARLVGYREVAAVERDAVQAAVVAKGLDRRLDQPDAAVVAVALHVLDERGAALELQVIPLTRNDDQVGRLVTGHLGGEVAQDDSNRLAEKPIGRVADEPGPAIGFGANDHY